MGVFVGISSSVVAAIVLFVKGRFWLGGFAVLNAAVAAFIPHFPDDFPRLGMRFAPHA
jgi:hypothetical protein